jgi:hypothetical protein
MFKKFINEIEERYLSEQEIALLYKIREYANAHNEEDGHYSWEEVYKLMGCNI